MKVTLKAVVSLMIRIVNRVNMLMVRKIVRKMLLILIVLSIRRKIALKGRRA